MEYLLLQHPGHNRVYYNEARKLALAELQLASERLSVSCSDIKIIEIAGVRYLSLTTNKEISQKDLAVLSRLSFLFALFKKSGGEDQISLIPLQKDELQFIDNKISSILKYQGKTNELFTRMMVNVALLSSNFDYEDNISLLDPVAGKGTTLFEASVYGFNAYGIELEAKSVHETTIFFKKYLERERIKHTADKRQVAGTSKKDAVLMSEFSYAFSKEQFKSYENQKKLGLVCGNTKDADLYFKKNQFHLLVGDLPYGIVHGNTTNKRSASITRNPSELLSESLQQWYKVLKKGGIVIVAWNSFLASRAKMAALFSKSGFEVLDSEPFQNFEHMVDKSIKRDVVVAKKV